SDALLAPFGSVSMRWVLERVLATLMIVGKAGSAIAAEIGIYRYSEQIDALTTMTTDPLGYLITPRLLAALLVFPILTTAFVLVGTFGGYLSGCCLLGLDSGVYWSNVHSAVRFVD